MSHEPEHEPSASPDTRVVRRRRVSLRLVVVFSTSVVVGTLGHLLGERATHRGRVLPGVSSLGVPLGGLSGDALARALGEVDALAARRSGKVQVGARTFDVTAESIGARLDVASTAARALACGREGGLGSEIAWFVTRPFVRPGPEPALRLDPGRVESLLRSLERAALGEPAVEGAVTYDRRVTATYPREGSAIERDGVEGLLATALVGRSPRPVTLRVRLRKPALDRAAVDAGVAEAARLVGSDVVLRSPSGEAVLTFEPEDLASALRSRVDGGPPARLVPYLDEAALRAVVEQRRGKVERPPRDATFAIGPRREVTVVPSEPGARLDVDAVVAAARRLASAAAPRTGELTLHDDVAPALTTADAEALHVTKLVAQYTTHFPCCEARVKNIERMAALVNGVVVRPGASFSVNEHAGPRTTANGFVGGPTIVEGEMETTIGGGVSQFATTLFNAVFDGGYEIVQRQPHTYWFPRYPEGHDATLGFPLPDLAFRNDTEAGLFIRATTGPTWVRVELFGDNGGRRVERHVSQRFDVVKPELVLEPDPTLPPEEPKVLFGGWTGWSVNATRVVTFPDGTRKEERRKVTYNPRARRVATHPCKIPEGQPGHTGEKCPEPPEPDGGAP